MKYYKDENNNPFVYENGVKSEAQWKQEVESKLGVVLTLTTKAEVDAILAPTPKQVLEKQREALKTARDTALDDNEYALSDGSVYQVRLSDLTNFQMSISLGVDTMWVLKDNSTRLTTVAELDEIMTAGVAQAKLIWDEYIAALGSL